MSLYLKLTHNPLIIEIWLLKDGNNIAYFISKIILRIFPINSFKEQLMFEHGIIYCYNLNLQYYILYI